MQRFLIIAVIALLVIGCSKKDGDDTPSSPQSNGTDQQQTNITPGSEVSPETSTDDSSGKGSTDPAFKDYEYPASALEDTLAMGNTVSNIYKSPDEFAKVVAFYKQKFPDAPDQPGTSIYFVTTLQDKSSLTVTLTKLDDGVQIILRKDKSL
jgi:hypothetical protein